MIFIGIRLLLKYTAFANMLLLRHIFEVSATEIPGVFGKLAMALALEFFLPIEKIINERGLLLNCVVGVAFLFTKELTFLGLAFLLVRLPTGLISVFAVSDGGHVAKAFALAFCWLAMRDFFYYWLHRLQHASKWLWAEHELHTPMNMLTPLLA
jgi:sterol desaturase/sphingolipid hydroxylase (fatty acid hydroxylase superfamily)